MTESLGEKVCPQCGTSYGAEHRFCTLDGATLVASQTSDTMVNQVVADRYHVLEKIGEGGFGEVYLAEHVRIRRKVAIKVMRKWMTSDSTALGRFHREAENASQISHPNVATIYDFGETGDGMVYLAMEYVDGEPLSSVLDRVGRLDAMRSLDIVRQTADGLSAAHAIGILHRDLKPDNLMLAKSRGGTDQVKVVDFGISRVMHRGTQQFTSTGMILGTPDYMSPEQLSGDQLDERTDVYALALIAYRMLAGTGAFGSGNAQETLFARLTKGPSLLREAVPAVEWPATVQEVFRKALASDPSTRHGDAIAFANDLDTSMAGFPFTPEDQAYALALSHRSATPPRGFGAIDAATPSRGVAPLVGGAREAPVPETPPSDVAALSSDAVAESADLSSPGATRDAIAGGSSRGRAFRWSAIGVAALGVVAVVSRFRHSGETPVPAVSLDTAVAIRAKTAPPLPDTALPVVPAPVATNSSAIRSDVIAARYARSVFAVSSAAGHGAGFLADSTGLVVTSASLIPNDRSITIQVDGTHRYRAPVLALDQGIAVALLPARVCRGCPVLAVTTDSIERRAGDSLVAIGSPESGGRSRRGVAASVSRDRVAASFEVGPRQTGSPLMWLTEQGEGEGGGAVAAVASRARSGATLVSASVVASVLSRAHQARSVARADTTLLPVWPAKRVAEAERNTGTSWGEREIGAYREKKDGFEVLVMTPQVVAWRRATMSGPVDPRSPFALAPRKKASESIRDPMQRWSEWDEYWRERRAVVMIDVSPEAARPPFTGTAKPVEFRKGDFVTAALLRDGTPVSAIEWARVVAVRDADAYAPRVPFHSGLLVFAPSDFATGARFRLEVVDASRPGKPIGIDIPQRTIDRIRSDLGAYIAR